MKSRSLSTRFLAAAMIVALQLAFIPTSSSSEAASLSGSVFSGDSKAPLEGAILRAGDPDTGEIYSSTPTDSRGTFMISELPPSTYALAVEADGGLYVVETPLTLAPGQAKSVQLAVQPGGEPAPDPEQARDEEGKGKLSFWQNPLTATLTVLGLATLFGVAIENAVDDNEPASPSQP